MGSVYLELFQTKPCCILVCPIIPYALCNTILQSQNVQIPARFPCLAKCCLAFFGGDAKSLAWVFLARRVLPFVFVFFCFFWGAMPNPSLGCFLLVGCCLSCLGSFVAFFGGRCQIPRLGVSCSSGAAFRVGVLFWPFLGAMPNPSLGCFLLVGCLLNGWSWDQSIQNCFKQSPVASLCALLSLTCYATPFCSPKMSKICQDFPVQPSAALPFLGAMPNPSLGCFLLVGCCLSFLFFFAFFGGRCQIHRLGVSCSSGAAFRAWVLLLPFLGAMPNLNGWSWDQSYVFHVVFSTKWTPCISLLNGFGVLVE